jgi:hypothetical protein
MKGLILPRRFIDTPLIPFTHDADVLRRSQYIRVDSSPSRTEEEP